MTIKRPLSFSKVPFPQTPVSKMKRAALSLAVPFLFAAAAHGQTNTLSWERAIELAAENNPELRAARADLEAAEAQTKAAFSGFFPQISGAVSASRGGTSTGTGAAVPPTETTSDLSYNASLTASQNLFSGFLDAAKVAQAKANERGARARFDAARARISADLKNAFQSLLYAQEADDLAAQILKRRTDNDRLVELRFDGGRENKGSVLLSNAYLEQARADVLQAANALKTARAQLGKSLGLEGLPAGEARGPLPLEGFAGAEPDFRALALATPDYRQAEAAEDAAQAALDQARSGFYPTLGLTGTVSKLGAEFFPEDRDRWSVALTLSIPLFSGGRDFYGSRGAAASFLSAQKTKENSRRLVAAQLQETYAAAIEAVARLKVDESFRRAAVTRAEIARTKYNNGLITFDDWDIIENDLINRQKAALQSARNRVTTEAAWRRALGQGVLP